MQNNGGFNSTFGNPGATMTFGGGSKPNSGNAFNNSGSAFTNNGSAFNQSGSNFTNYSNNANSNSSNFSSNNNAGGFSGGFAANQGSGSMNSLQGGGGDGRGRGGNSYRGGRGGSGGNRGSTNKTYIAPGLQQQQQQPPSTFVAGGDTNGSAFTSPAGPNNRGRGGYNRGRGGRGGAAPGQFRSLQWRADGAQTQQSTGSASMSMDDSSMGVATGAQGGFNNSAFGSGVPQQSQQHATSSFSGFGAQGQVQALNQNTGFGGGYQNGSAFGAQPTSWPSSTGVSSGIQSSGASQSAFGGVSSSASKSPAPHGFSATTGGGGFKQDSVFAAPAPRNTLSSENSNSRPGIASSAFTAHQKPPPAASESSAFSSSRRDPNNPLEDADSRLARFTAVPIGNRFEELKQKRVKEREDAIKRGDIPDPDKPVRLEDAISFVGTCRDMCPEFERHEREYQQNVERFEKIPGTEHINHARAVKAYARPAAGAEQPLPSDVRPPDVLLSTLDYLMTEIVAKGDLADSHAFIRDRTRSIRQDFTLQNNRGLEAVEAHEVIARYHIMCIHQLCENKNFSEQQEMEQLRKVLTSLQEFYDDMRMEGIPCQNEAEFRAYHILSHLQDPDMMRQAQLLPPHIFLDPYIQMAAEVNALTRRNNDIRRRAAIQSEASPNFFSRFFKMVDGPQITYLMACLLETNFGEIRKGALKALNKSYLDQHEGYPISDLVNILGFDDVEECIANCEEYDLELTNRGHLAVVFGRKDPVSRRRIFREGSIAIKQHRNHRLVEAKRQDYTVIQIIYGETPRPQLTNTPMGMSRPVATPISNMSLKTQSSQNFVSASASSIHGAAAAAAVPPRGSSVTAKPMGTMDFGLNRVSGSTSIPTAPSLSLPTGKTGSIARLPSQQPLLTGSSSTHPSLSTTFPSALPGTASGASSSKPPSNNISFTTPSILNPTTGTFKPPAPTGSLFISSQPGNTVSSSISATGAASSASQQPSFVFKAPGDAASSPFAFTGFTQPPLTSSTFTATAPSLSIPSALNPPPKLFTATSASSSTGSMFSTPPIPIPAPSIAPTPPKSDANRIVTKRGKIYPRSIVESVMNEFLQRETDRLIRATAAQMSQEVIVERSVRRAQERKEAIHQESMFTLSALMTQVTEDYIVEILAELHREHKLQRRVIDQWRNFTMNCRQRAEELRRRQEHFLANVRAMGSRAGLVDASPMAIKIRDYTSQQQRMRGVHSPVGRNGQTVTKDVQDIKAMVEAVSNKRKRMLSIGQEGSPDLALVAGLKNAVAPKREMWAPLPVLKVVESCYHRNAVEHSQSQQLMAPAGGPALMKRRWRLFVNSPNFREMTSKWLLTKLGIDMGRHTRSQQRSGTMVAVHQSQSTDENAMDVVVHGSEDSSVKDLLGMSKYSIMETAAFIFEFSKIPFADHEATDDIIRQYWSREHDRLVRFLACFPKVKQPIVFIMWTDAPEIWERISPHMVEYLQLDEMVRSPQGPLLAYRFLKLEMSSMKLDPYIIGSLEWLASETKDFFEDPAVLLESLLNKYRPIYEWALCRIALAEGPMYSQFDEDDEEETHLWRLRNKQRKQMLENGGGGGIGAGGLQEKQPRNMFVESAESGISLAVRLFNMELESIAQTIETKGQGETREGAAQEGKVKDAIARFIRQAELPEMKRGAIQDRINFGMDPKGALCDYIDVYIATLGGLAKEQQNLKAKSAMRQEIWEMLTSSKEDRVPLEAVFKRISNQILQWVKAGILDTERFSIRIRKWEQQRHDLQRLQGQYQERSGSAKLNEEEPEELTFTPMLIHDEVDVDGNVFDYEITVQSEVRAWEKDVETQARDREERAVAVSRSDFGQEGSSAGLLGMAANAPGGLRFGDSRKRRAPERPRDLMKKSRVGVKTSGTVEANEDRDLYLKHTQSPTKATPTGMFDGALLRNTTASATTSSMVPAPVTTPTRITPGFFTPQHGSPQRPVQARTGTGIYVDGIRGSPLEASYNSPSTSTTNVATAPSMPTTTAGDRLAKLRSLIKEIKSTTTY